MPTYAAKVTPIFRNDFVENILRYVQRHRRVRCVRGAADYSCTPVTPEVLQVKLTVFVELARQKIELKKQAQWLTLLVPEQTATNRQLKIES